MRADVKTVKRPKQAAVVTVEKIYLSRKELAVYLGISERQIKDTVDKLQGVERYKPSRNIVLYRKDNIDKVIRKSMME